MNRMRWTASVALPACLAAVAALVACAAEPRPTAAPTPVSESSVTPTTVLMPTATPEPTATPVLVPTATPLPAPAATSEPTATPTSAPTPTPQPTRTAPASVDDVAPSETLVMLADPLDEPEFYCVDVAGFGASLGRERPAAGAHLQAGRGRRDVRVQPAVRGAALPGPARPLHRGGRDEPLRAAVFGVAAAAVRVR